MHINRVLNHQYFYELYNQNYLSANKARLEVQKELNDAIKAQSTVRPFFETLGYEDAFSYLEAQSNLNRQTVYNFNTGLSEFQKSLFELSDSLISAQKALYSYRQAQSSEEPEREKSITIGEQEVKLLLSEDSDDSTKIYITDPNTLEINNYTVEDLRFETFYDEAGNINVRSSAELLLNGESYELALSENSSGNYIFHFVGDEISLSNDEFSIYDIYLSEKGLEFAIDIESFSSSQTIYSNDEALLDTLDILESRYGTFEDGFTKSLEEDAKEKQTSILEEFIKKTSTLGKFDLQQSILKLQINAIYEENSAQKSSTQLLYSLIK